MATTGGVTTRPSLTIDGAAVAATAAVVTNGSIRSMIPATPASAAGGLRRTSAVKASASLVALLAAEEGAGSATVTVSQGRRISVARKPSGVGGAGGDGLDGRTSSFADREAGGGGSFAFGPASSPPPVAAAPLSDGGGGGGGDGGPHDKRATTGDGAVLATPLPRRSTHDAPGGGGGDGGDSGGGATGEPTLVIEEQRPWYIIPHDGRFMRVWDATVVLTLMFVGLVQPFEIAFLPPVPAATDPMFVINTFIQSLFGLDFFLNFLKPYYDAGEGEWVYSPRLIARHYLRRMFFINLLTALPWDVMLRVSDASSLRLLRFLRFVRLAKVLRTLQANKLVDRLKVRFGVQTVTLSLVTFVLLLVILAHWMACLYHLTAVLTPAGVPTWLSEASRDFQYINSPFEHYSASLQWAMGIVSLAGAGAYAPQNPQERAIAVLCQLVAACVHALLVGTVATIMLQADRAAQEVSAFRDDLNRYMNDVRLPVELRMRTREQFDATARYLVATSRAHTMHSLVLPHRLQRDIASHSHLPWVSRISCFNAPDVEERAAFILALQPHLQPFVAGPLEVIVREASVADTLYLITKGLAVSGSGVRLLSAHEHFGLEFLLSSGPRYNTTLRSVTFLFALTLSKEALVSVMATGRYEVTRKLVRKATIRMALRREFLDAVRMSRLHRGFLMTMLGRSDDGDESAKSPPAYARSGIGGLFRRPSRGDLLAPAGGGSWAQRHGAGGHSGAASHRGVPTASHRSLHDRSVSPPDLGGAGAGAGAGTGVGDAGSGGGGSMLMRVGSRTGAAMRWLGDAITSTVLRATASQQRLVEGSGGGGIGASSSMTSTSPPVAAGGPTRYAPTWRPSPARNGGAGTVPTENAPDLAFLGSGEVPVLSAGMAGSTAMSPGYGPRPLASTAPVRLMESPHDSARGSSSAAESASSAAGGRSSSVASVSGVVIAPAATRASSMAGGAARAPGSPPNGIATGSVRRVASRTRVGLGLASPLGGGGGDGASSSFRRRSTGDRPIAIKRGAGGLVVSTGLTQGVPQPAAVLSPPSASELIIGVIASPAAAGAAATGAVPRMDFAGFDGDTAHAETAAGPAAYVGPNPSSAAPAAAASPTAPSRQALKPTMSMGSLPASARSAHSMHSMDSGMGWGGGGGGDRIESPGSADGSPPPTTRNLLTHAAPTLPDVLEGLRTVRSESMLFTNAQAGVLTVRLSPRRGSGGGGGGGSGEGVVVVSDDGGGSGDMGGPATMHTLPGSAMAPPAASGAGSPAAATAATTSTSALLAAASGGGSSARTKPVFGVAGGRRRGPGGVGMRGGMGGLAFDVGALDAVPEVDENLLSPANAAAKPGAGRLGLHAGGRRHTDPFVFPAADTARREVEAEDAAAAAAAAAAPLAPSLSDGSLGAGPGGAGSSATSGGGESLPDSVTASPRSMVLTSIADDRAGDGRSSPSQPHASPSPSPPPPFVPALLLSGSGKVDTLGGHMGAAPTMAPATPLGSGTAVSTPAAAPAAAPSTPPDIPLATVRELEGMVEGMPLLARIMSRAKLAERFDAETAAALSGVGAMSSRSGTARSGRGSGRGPPLASATTSPSRPPLAPASGRSSGTAAGTGAGTGIALDAGGAHVSGRAGTLLPLSAIPATTHMMTARQGPVNGGSSSTSSRSTGRQPGTAADGSSPAIPQPLMPATAVTVGATPTSPGAATNAAATDATTDTAAPSPTLPLATMSARRMVGALTGALSARIIADGGAPVAATPLSGGAGEHTASRVAEAAQPLPSSPAESLAGESGGAVAMPVSRPRPPPPARFVLLDDSNGGEGAGTGGIGMSHRVLLSTRHAAASRGVPAGDEASAAETHGGGGNLLPLLTRALDDATGARKRVAELEAEVARLQERLQAATATLQSVQVGTGGAGETSRRSDVSVCGSWGWDVWRIAALALQAATLVVATAALAVVASRRC